MSHSALDKDDPGYVAPFFTERNKEETKSQDGKEEAKKEEKKDSPNEPLMSKANVSEGASQVTASKSVEQLSTNAEET